jgi:hypothetical protein
MEESSVVIVVIVVTVVAVFVVVVVSVVVVVVVQQLRLTHILKNSLFLPRRCCWSEVGTDIECTAT